MGVLKGLGGLLIVAAGVWSGAIPVLRLRRQQRTLEVLSAALLLLQAELRSSLAPLAALFSSVADGAEGVVGRFFRQLSLDIQAEPLSSPLHLMRRRLPLLGLEPRESAILLELGNALGCYDLESQLRLLEAVRERLRQAELRCGKRILSEGRGWSALGICTGLALAIVLV